METIKEKTIAQRISELMFRLNKNQSTFAEAIGVSQPTVRNIIKDVTKPRYELLQSILRAYPNINKD